MVLHRSKNVPMQARLGVMQSGRAQFGVGQYQPFVAVLLKGNLDASVLPLSFGVDNRADAETRVMYQLPQLKAA